MDDMAVCVCLQVVQTCRWMCLKETSLRVTSSLPPADGETLKEKHKMLFFFYEAVAKH